jgi:predicted metalloprotease with PDZ domain
VEVAVTVPTGGRPQVDLMMAVWTPGSYLVREFSRHVERVTATASDGRALAVSKTRKNRWAIQLPTPNSQPPTPDVPSSNESLTVTVTYRVYGREMSVRTNWIERDFALLNGAPTFMTVPELMSGPHEILIEPASDWTQSRTALPPASDRPHHYVASSYDHLVDSPIVLGNPVVSEFTVDGKPHWLVNEGDAGVFDGARAALDVQRVVAEHRRMWGFLPYERYLFLNMITEGGGGLEHAESTVLMTSRWATRTRKVYLAWLGLVSHEFFHVWNVKRFRPAELGPFDYEREVHTRSLWVAEGITEYYGDLALHRAGLMTRDEYLEVLSSKIEGVQTTPGREVQSLSLASFDAWIKLYRPDENSVNSAMSYYIKGAVVAFLLDARIRSATNGAASLDDVLRTAYGQYSAERGFTADEIQRAIEGAVGTSLRDFWSNALDGTAELDYAPALETFGLRFKVAAPAPDVKPWPGVATRNDAGRLVVSQVRRDGPAFGAGVNVDDEILAIDGFRVRADRFDERLQQYRPGDAVSILVARRERLVTIDLVLATEPAREWRLEVLPELSASQADHLTAWLQPTR